VHITDFQLTSTGRGETPGEDWIPAVIPGGVHESLLAAGRIEHPYFGDHEESVRWVEDRVWWYRAQFAGDAAPGERVVLVLDGLDTVAEVHLNGELIGTHANQHRPFKSDVTDRLQPANELLLKVSPPLDGLMTEDEKEAAAARSIAATEKVRPGIEPLPLDQLILSAQRGRLRKASLSWGWDFAPRVASVGLTGGASLRRTRVAEVVAVGFTTVSLEGGSATVSVRVESDCFAGVPDQVRIRLTAPDGSVTEALADGAAVVEQRLVVPDAQLWWTHDLGEQPLYDVTVELLHDGDVIDQQSRRVGIRTIELDRSADVEEGGHLFRFVLNGVPLFARGANWVPASMMVGSIPAQTYRSLVQLARDGEMNMIRMWGGGTYEPSAWFDACDELGVLVWQDFMFAGAEYVTTPSLVAEVELEAAHQVRRLGHHASLALWCGENEVAAIRQLGGLSIEPGEWGWRVFNELLPAAVREHAPGAHYWPGSPWGETPGEIINGVSDGDRHAWEVWHGLDIGAGGPTEFATRGEAVHFHRYGNDLGKFISEFGIHASPEVGTLERWTPAGSLALRSPAFDQRNKDTPKDKGWALMEHETGIPGDLQEYVDFSMACQAEGLKFGIEHYRRRQPHCSGTLVWQLNDAWPGFSWSVIDYDLVPKAAYWFLQRVYRPVLASFRLAGPDLELWVTNSSTTDRELDLQVQLGFDGVLEDLVVKSPALSSAPVWTGTSPSDIARVLSPSGAVETNRAFCQPLKELPISSAPVTAEVVRSDGSSCDVVLRASAYSYLARLQSTDPQTRYDGNYVDLAAGEERVIRVTGLSPEASLSVASYGHGPVGL
jgi:beta-mannosidase